MKLHVPYLIITIVVAAMVAFSALMKLRRDERVVRTIHEVVGVPLQLFPVLAALEFAGALGLVLGMRWPMLGVAAGICLVLYFVGAMLSHLRVRDFAGVGPAFFMFVAAVVALTFRMHLGPHPHWH